MALDTEERIFAIARGIPPHWVVDIPGTEAWAIYQAGLKAEPGSSIRSDCKPCVDTIIEGKVVSCSSKRPLARVNSLMHHVLDDAGPNSVVWMPAHTTEASIGTKKLSDGSVLTATDRKTNGRADEQAKIAAEAVRAPPEMRQDLDDYWQNIEDASIWLGMVTWMAGNMQGPVKRDSGASALKAMQHNKQQEVLKKDRCIEPSIRVPSEGGHVLVSDGQLRWCAMCGTRGFLRSIGQQKCSGTKRDKWFQKSFEPTEKVQQPEYNSLGHLKMMSGQVVWCDRCGAYGTHRGCGLARPCTGHATMGAGGGKWQRLLLLREGRLPKGKSWLGAPIPEARWSSASVSNVNIAVTETRQRDEILAQKSGATCAQEKAKSCLPLVSRLEQVKRRVRAKEHGADKSPAAANRLADNSSRSACTGMSSSIASKFEAMRLRIKMKELAAMGEVHVPD